MVGTWGAPMNIPVLLIAGGIGVAVFAAECRWYYQPDWLTPDIGISFDFLSTQHMKARDAVRHRLVNPGSAQFGELRSVEAEKAKYVCGSVNARDKAGHVVAAD